MFYSPLEQFQILPLVTFGTGIIDLSITNAMLATGSICLFLFCVFYALTIFKYKFIPARWQVLFENMYVITAGLVWDSIGSRGQKYFPLIFTIFSFILISNLSGLIPYSFTTTSHLIQTITLSLIIFLGSFIICVSIHGSLMLTLFLPGGTGLSLAFLLVPLEIISYIFKPISLGVRLFANMMAGHTLLKVIAGFAWTMMGGSTFLLIGHLLPLSVLIILFGLEMAVALIQAYVFTILTCIYINDALVLH